MRDYGFSPAQQDEMWRRWREGQSFSLIGRALGAPMQHAHRYLYQSGGIRLAPQTRSERHLSGSEREEISRGITAGESARQMAKRLGRSPSTVSREISRNGGRDRYRSASADATAYEHGRRPKQAKLAQQPTLRALVEAKLALCWSPKQIAEWLRRQFPGDASMQISHEAIHLSSTTLAGARRSTAASPRSRGQADPCAVRRSPAGPPTRSPRSQDCLSSQSARLDRQHLVHPGRQLGVFPPGRRDREEGLPICIGSGARSAILKLVMHPSAQVGRHFVEGAVDLRHARQTGTRCVRRLPIEADGRSSGRIRPPDDEVPQRDHLVPRRQRALDRGRFGHAARLSARSSVFEAPTPST